MHTRTIARAIILVAIGVALSPFTSIPIGIAKINPTQHFVNIVSAVLSVHGGQRHCHDDWHLRNAWVQGHCCVFQEA
jgi:hypothetical protein